MAIITKTDVFQFMSVRSPQTVERNRFRNFYIQDDYINQDKHTKKLREVFSINSASQVGKILYQKIFCENSDKTIEEKNAEIVTAILELLDFKTVMCEVGTNFPPETLVNELEQFPYIYSDYKYYLLPTKLDNIKSKFDIKKIFSVQKILEKQIKKFDREVLFDDLRKLFGVKLLTDVVFDKETYQADFQELKNILFERLYLLYILRRIVTVNLEEIIKGLQILHTLEFLAVEDLLGAIKSGRVSLNAQEITRLIKFLSEIFPELQDLDLTSTNLDFHFIGSSEDLANYLESTPVIHPIVAQLHWYRRPFNKITPIGIGDLKVVKQWLVGYKVGEISHIQNIMKGEENERNHRRLEKTEEVFSFSSESNENTQSENQSTDRFETKREAERVIKTDLSVGANVGSNLSYSAGTYAIQVNVGANFAYSNSNQDTQKSASNYAREVMDKAVTQIQNRATQNRSITKIFETEETNKHSYKNNQPGATHTSGIYRWLDKKYKAALYNYGKRLMFEFIIPEPAAFYVLSKLKAAEIEMNIPSKPSEPNYETAKIIKPGTPDTELKPEEIDETMFNQLRLIYDLAEFTYPQDELKLPFSDLEKKNNLAVNLGNAGDKVWTNNQYKTKGPEGYNVKTVEIVGSVTFGYEGIPVFDPLDFNKWLFTLNAVNFWDRRNYLVLDTRGSWSLDSVTTLATPINAKSGDIFLDVSFQDLMQYSMMVFLGLVIDSDYKLDWQTKVYNKIKSIEQKEVDRKNQELEIAYNSEMADYRNKLNDLAAQTVNDIIQGRSEAFNQQIIREELKKHCLTMITKEFDAFDADDILSNEDALEDKSVKIEYERFSVYEKSYNERLSAKLNGNTTTVAEFKKVCQEVKYPKIKIDIAKKKARYIQFLEQAFEWQNIAYIFYPYFWAKENKWIELMNRLDYTDNNMTAFLKAGSVRVLIAVTPLYNDAVMHFLATREPWDGGPLPVIGDALFIPIYEEIRKQQDDLQNAVQEGKPWDFELPTSLIYLQDSSSPIPEDLEVDEA